MLHKHLIIRQLQTQVNRINKAIAILKGGRTTSTTGVRKPLTLAKRKQISAKMKLHWAKKKQSAA